MLHSLVTPDMIAPKNPQQRPLLLHAAFHDSPSSALYLLKRGIKLDAADA
jgi:hypothetical protein